MNIRVVSMIATLSVLLLGANGSCSGGAPASAGAAADAPGASTVVARVGDRSLTLAELDASIANQLFEARVEAVDRWVNEAIMKAEAAKRGIEVGDVLQAVADEMGPIPDEEVAAFFDQNKERMPPDSTLEGMADQIRQFLGQQRAASAMQALRESTDAKVMLEPPRIEVAAIGPSRGPADAPITIIEFSDYQCPFCSRAEPTIAAVLERYPGQVRFVYRHFPLDQIHPRARKAAEAANCAHEQEKFWAYHDLIFANPRQLEDDDLRNYAQEVGLELGAFDSCVKNPEVAAAVQRDVEEGAAAGATGTPAFFVNGMLLSGARPVDDFVQVIESELERLGS